MRAAHLLAGAQEGGAERFFERLIPALARAGDTILPVIRDQAGRAARLRQAGTPPRTLPFGGALDVITRPLLSRQLHRFAPAVVVAWMGRAARHAPTGPWVLAGRLGGYYSLARFARCDHIVANTEAIAAWARAEGFPAARIHILPNFVPDLSGATQASLPVPPGAPIVLTLGRLHRAKGHDVLIAAITRLPGVHAVIAGDGPERAALESLARQAGVAARVHFLGWRHDTAELLAACHVLACPSRQEPLGNQILEAFSAHRPVVAAMSEGPAHLLAGGQRGILVPIDSGIALAAGIEAMLNNPAMAQSTADAARAFVRAHHSEEAVVPQWRDFSARIAKP
jgi:glycosyltransferase involved in cell wall biosynthesis